jgi:DNA polymerase-3 subunit alpha
MAKFTHLHVHTEYSLLDGLSKIEELIAKALELGMDSIAITDHGVMYGAIKFYLTAKEFGIKPIIGMETYMAARSRFDKQANIDSDRYHLILLAKNEIGYKNLMKLTSLAHLEGFYYRPRIDMEILRQYSEGVIATSACLDGEIPSLLLQNRKKDAEKKALEFQKIFKEDFYLELQHHPKIPRQKDANEELIKLSRKLGIPLVATNDIHYVNADDAEAQDALLAVQTQKMIADKNRMTMIDSPDFYLRSQEEMIEAFRNVPDAIENTRQISRKCNVTIPLGKWILPNYPLPEGETPEEYLRKLTYERIHDRFPKPSKEIVERIDYELDVICKKGFATYFLIVQDFVNWAKQQKIRVGPGRGSVAGSLVSYILRITSIDPLKHNLPFERFMNPERPSPPDIDLDFADDRRDEVIEYISQRYGRDKVAQIVTFNIMKAREAIRDIGRVLGFPYSDPDKIAKLIPFGMNIEQALKSVPELGAFYQQPKFKKLLDLAQRVEGTARHASTHAAGVVIADKEITEYTPVQKETHGERIMTQYDMYSMDLNVSESAIGLLKIDILGLRNLTILEKTMNYIQLLRGTEVDLSEIPLDDKKALALIAAGETTGMFQLESAGMRRLARKLKVNRFSDIAAMVALYRPGPMIFIDEFLAGKKNPGKIEYPHPDLKPILEETYGIAVYQEQCLHIANVMGGYSLGEADILRRAIGKKKKAMMTKEKNKFIQRAVGKGYKKEVAEKVFAFIERFAGYGFNKAHSTSYAMIAYQTAYLKAHYPVEFMAALLTAETEGASGPIKDRKISIAVGECRRMGNTVLAPHITTSKVGFTIEEKEGSYEGKAIRFGLSAIKNVGEAAIKAILDSREVGGDFKSLVDFCRRVDQQKVNKKVLESLIKAGAMDQFGKRAAMLSGLEEIRKKAQSIQKQNSNGQTSIFDDPKVDSSKDLGETLPDVEEFSKDEKLLLEKELLGFYLTEHPLSKSLGKINSYRTHKLIELTGEEGQPRRVKIGGIISDLRIVFTRSGGREMAFVKIEDETSSVEVVVFPTIFQKAKAALIKDKVILINGKVELREGGTSLIAEELKSVEEMPDRESGGPPRDYDFEVQIPSRTSPTKLVALNKLFKQNQGKSRLALVFTDDLGRARRITLPFGVNYSSKLEKEIKKVVSAD